MRKLRTTLICLICLLLCFTTFAPTLFAAPTKTVYDYANLLTSSEREDLEMAIGKVKETYDTTDIYLVTTNDTEGKTSTAFADDFFFDLGYGKNGRNGVLLLIDMDNRNVWISTSGTSIAYFTDARIQLIIDKFYDKLREGNYYGVGKIFLRQVEAVISNPVPTTLREQTHLPRAPLSTEDYLLRGGIAALIALIVSAITYLCICRSYTHPRFTQPVAAPDRSSIDFTGKKDQFVHTHTSRVRIKDDSNSGGGGLGGGSSTHTSSGGGNFGGGGRGF